MALERAVILGIDLGTTFSAIATVGADGRPVTVPNSLGEPTTPSVVHFESASSVLVGTAARDAATVDPDNTVALIKRQMGGEFELLFHGVRHTPESVSALILRSLVDDAATALGQDGPVRAVITVPAYFGIREREATYQAAHLAGIEVLELLSEPVAAALHYGTTERFGGDGGAVLVYDLGGGTFDTTVLRVSRGGVRVVATDGDSSLGGADWDGRIADFLAGHLTGQAGRPDLDEDTFWPEVAAAAEAAKRSLSATISRPVVLRCGGAVVTVDFDRATLERLGADLVERTLLIVDRVLDSAAAHGVRRIDQVIMVGGSTKMPAIAGAVAERLGRIPKLVEPDLAVVYGAAIRAHQLADDGSRAELRKAGGMLAAIADKPTTSVVPRSFGVLVNDSHDPEGVRRLVVHTVHRNAPLPASATVVLSTIVDDQDRVRVQIFEQAGDLPSDDPADNRRVLDGELSNLPPLPAGSQIEVTLRVSADGLLSVTAREARSGVSLDLQAYVDGVVDAGAVDQLAGALTGIGLRRDPGQGVGMSSWVRSDFDGIGLTQSPPGKYLEVLQRQYGGTVLLCIDVSGSMCGEPLRQAVKGGEQFLREVVDARYTCGLVLWNHQVERYVAPDTQNSEVLDVLRNAQSMGGTDLVPTLLVAKKLFQPLRGDRVLCVFGDGDIGGRPTVVPLARELCAMGVRIVVRGLGAGATANLARLLCPGAPAADSQVIEDVDAIGSGIASMAAGLTALRRKG
ncbi:MAG: Hsp70 family protein [Pseudonocardiaceae bacterium]